MSKARSTTTVRRELQKLKVIEQSEKLNDGMNALLHGAEFALKWALGDQESLAPSYLIDWARKSRYRRRKPRP